MTEAEWLKSRYPAELLNQLTCRAVSERKALLLLVAALGDGSVEYSEVPESILVGLSRFAEAEISRDELNLVFQAQFRNDAPAQFTLENAHYSLATSEPARMAACKLTRDIFGNPFRPVAFDPAWRSSDVLALAAGIYDERAFDRMPILADAMQDAGCDSDDILNHLRDPNATHVRGCWALDLVLGKE